jgi:hypothetical protein
MTNTVTNVTHPGNFFASSAARLDRPAPSTLTHEFAQRFTWQMRQPGLLEPIILNGDAK